MPRLNLPTRPAEREADLPGPVTVAISGGLLDPLTVTSSAAARTAIWGVLRTLPIGWAQAEAFNDFLGAGLASRLDVFFARRNAVELAFSMHGVTHLVTIAQAAG